MAWLEAKLGRLARFYATPWRQITSPKPGLQPDNDDSQRDDAFAMDGAAVGEFLARSFAEMDAKLKAARLREASAAAQARPQEGARAGGTEG